MHDFWRGLNKPHMGICSLSAHFEATRLCEDGLQKDDGKRNRYGS